MILGPANTLSPFLTDLDPRAAVKGSRDPLGIQSVWIRFGRHVVGNLTNASNSVRDFTVLMLGCHYAETLAKAKGPGGELATFLKWEQLSAYARGHINGDFSFRGTERVRENLGERTVTISADIEHQILSNQKTYGIWALYSVPGSTSGLLEGSPPRLTSAARKFVQATYLPQLTTLGLGGRDRIEELLGEDQFKLTPEKPEDRRILAAVAKVLRLESGHAEREFYREFVLQGGPKDRTEGKQRLLAELLAPKLLEGPLNWSPAVVLGLAKEAGRLGVTGQDLSHRLQRIEAAERILAPASDLFLYLLGCDKVSVREVARRMRTSDGWGKRVATIEVSRVADLKAEFAHGDTGNGDRWEQVALAMGNGRYEDLIGLLIEQNKSVMLARGGAAWIEIENGLIKVGFSEERGKLPGGDELPQLWRFPYFLDSICSIAQVINKGRGK
jgi:hypothetical protein